MGAEARLEFVCRSVLPREILSESSTCSYLLVKYYEADLSLCRLGNGDCLHMKLVGAQS